MVCNWWISIHFVSFCFQGSSVCRQNNITAQVRDIRLQIDCMIVSLMAMLNMKLSWTLNFRVYGLLKGTVLIAAVEASCFLKQVMEILHCIRKNWNKVLIDSNK